MGLTTWKSCSDGKILKSDVSVAKNYLSEKELNRIVNIYLDYAELQASRKIPMKMEDWVNKLDVFLNFNDYKALKDSGKISAEVAKKVS